MSATGVSTRGVCLPGGCTPPPVNRITDNCKNFTFLQLRLGTVVNFNSARAGWLCSNGLDGYCGFVFGYTLGPVYTKH